MSGIERCINDEIPFDIPNSWEWVRLNTIFDIVMGSSPNGNTINTIKNGMEFHQGKTFFSDYCINNSNTYTTTPTKIAFPNSILLCVRAPVGKINVVDRTICIGRGLASINGLYIIKSKFIYYFLLAFESYFVEQSTGTTFKAITTDIVKNCLFPLPPLNEQEKIMKTVDKIFNIISK